MRRPGGLSSQPPCGPCVLPACQAWETGRPGFCSPPTWPPARGTLCPFWGAVRGWPAGRQPVSEPPASPGTECSLVVTVCPGEQPAPPPTGAGRRHCTRQARPRPGRVETRRHHRAAHPRRSRAPRAHGRVAAPWPVRRPRRLVTEAPTAFAPAFRGRRPPVPSARRGNWRPLEPQRPAGLVPPRAPSRSPLSR